MNIFVENDGPYGPRSIFRKRPVSGLQHQQQPKQQHQGTCPCCGALLSSSSSWQPDAGVVDEAVAEPQSENQSDVQPEVPSDPLYDVPPDIIEVPPQVDSVSVSTLEEDGAPNGEPAESGEASNSTAEQWQAQVCDEGMIPLARVMQVFEALINCVTHELVFNPSILRRIQDSVSKCLYSMMSPEEFAKLQAMSDPQPEGICT